MPIPRLFSQAFPFKDGMVLYSERESSVPQKSDEKKAGSPALHTTTLSHTESIDVPTDFCFSSKTRNLHVFSALLRFVCGKRMQVHRNFGTDVNLASDISARIPHNFHPDLLKSRNRL
jgi:hypothetical protein